MQVLHRRSFCVAALVLSSMPAGCLRAPPPSSAAGPAAKASYYRLDYVVSAKDPTAAASTNAYSMVVEENHWGKVMVGSNVPLSTSMRTDVGLRISGECRRADDEQVAVETQVEMTSAEGGSGFHKLLANGDALVTPGSRALVASLDDPSARTRYEISVTATRVR